MINLPEWAFWVFTAIFAVVAVYVLWNLFVSGEVVGSVEGRWSTQMMTGSGTARVLVQRLGAEKSGVPTVRLQLRVTGMAQAYSYTSYEARELADLLDEAARKVYPR